VQATPEDVDYRAARGLDRALFQKLTGGEWIERHENLLVTGPTGTGKTWLTCALGHRACRDNRSVVYHRVPRLADAVLDRLVHTAHRIELKGESLRKLRAAKATRLDETAGS
jgi:DNA replication protein DnaC